MGTVSFINLSPNLDWVILAQNYLTFFREDKLFLVLIDIQCLLSLHHATRFILFLRPDHHLIFENTTTVSVFPQVTVNSPATESLISLLVKLIGNVM
jgi:hypothetical protein